MISEAAPAKINLALHVIGKRPDGYHLLDSLVVFAGVGDVVEVSPADDLTLAVEGPFAAGLTGDNLVMRAARAFGAGRGAAIRLVKNLPVASGIGGGSADAAACLRALSRLWGVPVPDALPLGADVPVCLAGRPARMSGIGEVLMPVPALPEAWLVLANPGVAVSTASVFGRLAGFGSGLPEVPVFADAAGLADWLGSTRSDLEGPALELCPEIGVLLGDLAALPGCLLARMSGSGATCFGLFTTQGEAELAARGLRVRRPGEWIVATGIQP